MGNVMDIGGSKGLDTSEMEVATSVCGHTETGKATDCAR